MNQNEITNALSQALEGAGLGYAIHYEAEDVSSEDPLPYLLFDDVPTSRRVRTLSGLKMLVEGYVIITAVTETGNFANRGRTIVHEVAGVYPATRRFTLPSGNLTIMDPPEPLKGYPRDADWRTPLRVTYRARD